MSLKLINLGLPKSGTTTLGKALKQAGWNVADHKLRPPQVDDPAMAGRLVGDLMYQGYYGSGDPLEYLAGFDAITECNALQGKLSLWPQMDVALLRALRAHHPGVKFVATRRSGFDISQSMLAWTNLGTTRLPRADVPGLPAGYGETTRERVRWIEGHYETLRQLFRDDPDFLEIDVAHPDSPAQLSAFLQVELPWWGQANINHKKPE